METLIFPKEVRTVYDSSLPALKHLKVKTAGSPSSRVADLEDALSWVSPSLETLSMEQSWAILRIYFDVPHFFSVLSLLIRGCLSFYQVVVLSNPWTIVVFQFVVVSRIYLFNNIVVLHFRKKRIFYILELHTTSLRKRREQRHSAFTTYPFYFFLPEKLI